MSTGLRALRRPILPGERRGDCYALPEADGTITWYVRVSNALDEVAKQRFLGPWHGRMAARYAFANPFATEDEAVGAAYRMRDRAADKGSLIHSWVEAVVRGGEMTPDGLPQDERPYALGFLKFVAQYRPELVHAEASVFNRTHHYAGQADLFVRLHSGDLALIDVKTGRGVYDWDHALQLSAYRRCEVIVDHLSREVQQMPRVDYAGVLHLRSTGTYALHEMPDRFQDFLSYLHIYNRRHDRACPPACYCWGMA